MNVDKKFGLEILDYFRSDVPTIPQMFYKTVRNAGEKPANTFKAGKEWKTITYREWAEISEEIAVSLIQKGVKKGDDICIMSKLCAQRGWADIAVLLTGAVSATVSPLVSDKDLEYILNRSDVKFIFVENEYMVKRVESLWHRLPFLKGIICLQDQYAGNQKNIWDLEEFRASHKGSINAMDLATYWRRLTEDDPARLNYTCSSTGRLNCTQINHGEWIAAERRGHRSILTENLNGYYNDVFASIMPMASMKERTTGYFSMIAIGALIKYGPGPSEIKSLGEIKQKRQLAKAI